MSRSVTVNTGKSHTQVGGAEHNAGDVVTVSNAEYTALVAAGRFTDGTLTDGGAAVATNADDTVSVQAGDIANLGALTSAQVGAAPSQAQFNALQTDVATLYTNVNALLTALRGSGKAMA